MSKILWTFLSMLISIHSTQAQKQQTVIIKNTVSSTHPFSFEKNYPLPKELKATSLGTFFIPRNQHLEVKDLRLWCGGDFIPVRVGSSEGRVTMFLRGGLISTFYGKEEDNLSHEYLYYTHAWQEGSSSPQRLLNYRWLVIEKNDNDAEKAGVKVYIDTLSSAGEHQYFTHLKEKQEVYFWMSSHGINNVYFVDDTVFNAIPQAKKPEYAIWDSNNDLQLTLSFYRHSTWEDGKNIDKKNEWGANVSTLRRIIKSRDDIKTKSEDFYLHHEYNIPRLLIDYEVTIVQWLPATKDNKIENGVLYSAAMPDGHVLVKVKRL